MVLCIMLSDTNDNNPSLSVAKITLRRTAGITLQIVLQQSRSTLDQFPKRVVPNSHLDTKKWENIVQVKK